MSGRRRRVDHPREDGLGLDPERKLAVIRVEGRGRAIENLDGFGVALGAEEHERQDPRGAGRRDGVRRSLHGLSEMLLPAGEAGDGLGHAQLEEQPRMVARRRRLCERATEKDRLCLGSASPPRRGCSFDETFVHPGVGGGLADQQVLRDPVVLARLLGEQLGRATVTSCALLVRELLVQTGTDDRMDEREWSTRLEDAGGDEHVGGLGRLQLVEVRKPRGLEEVALLEQRQRAGESVRRLGEQAKPEADRAADRSSADSLHATRVRRCWSEPALAERIHEHADEERGAPRRTQARVEEHGIRNLPERCLRETRDRGPRERRKTDHLGGCIGDQRGQKRGIRATFARTRRHDERDIQLLDARQQEGEEA